MCFAFTALKTLARASHGRCVQASVLEARILNAIKDVDGRGKAGISTTQQDELNDAVAALEAPSQGVPNPTARPEILDGRHASLCSWLWPITARWHAHQYRRMLVRFAGAKRAGGSCCTLVDQAQLRLSRERSRALRRSRYSKRFG